MFIVLGSGGHTTEMLRMLKVLDKTIFTPRVYFIAHSDKLSVKKLLEYEQDNKTKFYIRYIPRARSVKQSMFTSVFTTIYSILYSIFFFMIDMPDFVICNGPGTCIPICLVAILQRVFFIKKIPIIYIESFARVYSLSLTGKILYRFADRFIVQWPELVEKYPKAEYKNVI